MSRRPRSAAPATRCVVWALTQPPGIRPTPALSRKRPCSGQPHSRVVAFPPILAATFSVVVFESG